MKELGRYITYYSVNKEKWTHIHTTSYIFYAEPDKDEITEIKYEDLDMNNHKFMYHKPSLFDRKEYKYTDYHWDYYYNVYPGQTLYIKKVWESIDFTCSFECLSREMRSDDFIEYIKDRGLSVCPIGGR